MQMSEVREFAKQYGLKTGRMNKASIIQLIQKEEGNFDCFATAIDGYCDQPECLWRSDCFKAAK